MERNRGWGVCSLTNCKHIFGFYDKQVSVLTTPFVINNGRGNPAPTGPHPSERRKTPNVLFNIASRKFRYSIPSLSSITGGETPPLRGPHPSERRKTPWSAVAEIRYFYRHRKMSGRNREMCDTLFKPVLGGTPPNRHGITARQDWTSPGNGS